MAGGVERQVEVGEEVALLRFAGLGGEGGEVGRKGFVIEQVALQLLPTKVELVSDCRKIP